MRIRVTAIRNMALRRLAIVASLPFLFAILFPLSIVSNVLRLVQGAHAAWRDPVPAPEVCEVGVLGDAIVISMPIDLLVHATEHSPMAHHLDPDVVASHGGLTITDRKAFATEITRALRAEQDERGTTFIHQMFDDAVESVVDNGGEGFSWPAAGIE